MEVQEEVEVHGTQVDQEEQVIVHQQVLLKVVMEEQVIMLQVYLMLH